MRAFTVLFALACAISLLPGPAFAANGQPPSSAPDSEPRPQRLSMREAIDDALATNVQTRVADTRRSEAAGERITARSAFLPHLSADVKQSRQRVNLAAQGFDLDLPGFTPLITYNNFQARAQLRQKLFDYSAWERYQSARIGEHIAAARLAVARQQVASQAELDYVSALAAEQAVAATQADLTLATRLLKLARDQEHEGLATRVDVTRARTRLAQASARLAQAKTDRVRAEIQLARTTGLPLDTPLHLSSRLTYQPVALGPASQDIAHALADRPEIRMARTRIRQGEKQLAAARGERLPTLSVSAAYGAAGNTYNRNEDGTYRIGAQLSVPLFDGERIRGHVDSATSRLDQQRIRYRDTRNQIEQDVRVARRTLTTLADRVHAARTGLHLARQELQRARNRFRHGVGDNIAVVDAQAALADARNTRVSALAEYTRARINLAAALGRAPQFDLQHPMAP